MIRSAFTSRAKLIASVSPWSSEAVRTRSFGGLWSARGWIQAEAARGSVQPLLLTAGGTMTSAKSFSRRESWSSLLERDQHARVGYDDSHESIDAFSAAQSSLVS